MSKEVEYIPITDLLTDIIDNRGKSVPTVERGFPLIATNCIKHSSIYPTFDKVRYVSENTLKTWFRAHIKPNDILFVNKGTPGRVCLVPNPVTFCAAQDMMAFRSDPEKINYKYLFAVLRTNEIQKKIENNHVGLVIPHFRKQELSSLLIPIKSKQEQKAIGDLYIVLSEKIELNNRINAELEAMAKTLYDYWFVQFDFPNAKGKPYKTSGGKMVWNEEIQREIPEGWEVKELQEIAKCLMGQSPKGESYNQDGIGTPLLNGPADYENGTLKGRTFTTEPTRLCQKDDLVLCIRATIGNLVYSEQEFCLGRGVAAVRVNDKRLSELIYFLLIQEIERFKVQATGSIIVGITKDDLIESKCLIPNDELIKYFHNLIKPQFDKIRINIQENLKLTELRDWLLPMLMNGQVKVKDEKETELSMAAEPKVNYGK